MRADRLLVIVVVVVACLVGATPAGAGCRGQRGDPPRALMAGTG
jgi:hypothetical protein